MSRLLPVVLALIAGLACTSTPTVSTAPPAPTVDVDRIARIAKAIRAEPARGKEILEKEGLERSDLEEAIFEIAADPALSAAYIEKVR